VGVQHLPSPAQQRCHLAHAAVRRLPAVVVPRAAGACAAGVVGASPAQRQQHTMSVKLKIENRGEGDFFSCCRQWAEPNDEHYYRLHHTVVYNDITLLAEPSLVMLAAAAKHASPRCSAEQR
jgi:hypothetical protein